MNIIEASCIDAVLLDEMSRTHNVTQEEDDLFSMLSNLNSFINYTRQVNHSVRAAMVKERTQTVQPIGIALMLAFGLGWKARGACVQAGDMQFILPKRLTMEDVNNELPSESSNQA